MTSTDVSNNPSMEMPEAATIDMKLEVVTLPVSDVDRAKRFYQSLGWWMDADIAVGDNFRAVQLTPLHSQCSAAFGKGLTADEPGSVQRLLLAVSGIDAAREDLISRGVEVSEVFHLAGGRVPGPDPQRRSYSPMPRSAIRVATDGCSSRSRHGFRAGRGRTRRTSLLWPASSMKRPSITTLMRRPCPARLVGLVCAYLDARAWEDAGGGIAGPRVAIWRKSCTLRPCEVHCGPP